MSELYNLIFFPTIKPGEDETEVKVQLALKLKVNAAKVDSWFATGKPTLLLKAVAPDVADRYMQAILACGGNCNMQPSGSDGKGSLSLVPKPSNVELFYCPSCEHEEELAPGETYEQCPKCNLVMAKWAERQEEERKKEEIRRRLLRDARFKDDAQSEEQRKKGELAELKRLEAEILKELGIKPPGRFWQFFSARPVSMSASIGILLVTLSSAISFYVSDYIDTQEELELAAEPASEEIQQMAPSIVDAVGLQLSGNQAVVDELAAATQLLSGQQMDAGALTSAAEQMMKGSGNEQFIQQANAAPTLKSTTPGGLGEPAPVSVNRGTLGGVKGLSGIDQISEEELALLRPNDVVHGQEEVLDVLTHTMQMPDPSNPNGPDVLVSKIDRLDGSSVVSLMKSMSRDLEWDRYLLSQVRDFLLDGKMDQAHELAVMIRNPTLKIEGFSREIEHLASKDPSADFKLMMAILSLEMNKVQQVDLRAKFWLRLGANLSSAEVPDQPLSIFSRVEGMADDTDDPAERAAIFARLAVAHLETINVSRAQILFMQAMKEAGRVTSVSKRITAFANISQRYYDARNLTIAAEILSEAQILGATELKTEERVSAFFEIATAQLYMGDVTGALQAVSNAASGSARQKLLAELAAWTIDQGEIFQAQALMAEISAASTEYRLAVRLISRVIHDGNERKATALISEYSPRPRQIEDPSERALVLSQFARLHLRLRQPDRADQLFKEALAISDQLTGRKAAVTRGVIALDQARGLWIGRAKVTMDDVTETIVSEPIATEITATERVIQNLLPQSVRDRIVDESS